MPTGSAESLGLATNNPFVSPPTPPSADVSAYASTSWGGLQPDLCSPTSQIAYAGSFRGVWVNARYAQLLKSLDFDIAKVLRFELKGFKKYECLNERCGLRYVYLPMISCGVYHPYVSSKHTNRAIAKTMARIEFVEKVARPDYLIKIDLTLPQHASFEYYRTRDNSKLRKAVNIFICELQKALFHHPSRLAGFYTTHVWKTKKPLVPHLHAHLNLFNVAFNPTDKTFHRFQPRLNERVVKRAWARALGKVGIGLPRWVKLPDVHLGYIKLRDRGRVVHRIRYVARRAIADLNSYIDNCSFEGVKREWLRHLLRYTPRVSWVGWGHNLGKFGYNSPKSFLETCPLCGGYMVYLGREPSLPPNVGWFGINRRGKLAPIHPPPFIINGFAAVSYNVSK